MAKNNRNGYGLREKQSLKPEIIEEEEEGEISYIFNLS